MSEHFIPTSSHPNWKGKVRCAYCPHAGWPAEGTTNPKHWTNRHGANCPHREAK